MSLKVKNLLHNFAAVYTIGSFGLYAIRRFETAFSSTIATEKKAQAAARLALCSSTSPQSKIKRLYHLATETLLSCPGVRIATYFVLTFFVGLHRNSSENLDNLWQRQEWEPLIYELEDRMNRPEGVAWAPRQPLHRAPPLHAGLQSMLKFCRDLTQMAEDGKLRPFFGRQKEMEKMGEVLGRNQKSNPILVGPPGVGKTSLGEGLAQRIVQNCEDLHPVFRGKRIFFLQWDLLVAGAEKYSGDTIETRLLRIINEAQTYREHVILFIDEIHAFLNPKNEGIVSMLKPPLADGSFRCIAATTSWDYHQLIETDPSLERRFPVVEVAEPKEGEMLQVLQAVIPRLEGHHGVHIGDEAVAECIALCSQYLKSQSFPDKAIDLLDQAASQLSTREKPYLDPKIQQLSYFLRLLVYMRNQAKDPSLLNRKIQEVRKRLSKVVTRDMIRSLVAQKVEIPLERVQESEREVLVKLEDLLSKKIVGQKRPIKSLCQGVRRARLRLGNPNAPAGVFLLVGTTGVGKTASVVALCESLYGSKDHMLRLDMSEYAHSSDMSKLIGAAPGYVGHGRGGILTNWLKKKPASIVLLDEIEKADRAIFDLFLGVFDAGRITDGNNETHRCLDVTFVMTSNIGSDEIHKFSSRNQPLDEELDNKDNDVDSEDALEKILLEKLSLSFRPEFIGRIQEITVFYPLSQDEIRQIAIMQCKELQKRVLANIGCSGIQFEWDNTLIEFLVKNGYSPKKGARGMVWLITKNVENTLADLIITKAINPGQKICFKAAANKVIYEIQQSLYPPIHLGIN